MPADDLVLNVRQIAQYTAQGSAPPSASLLMQLAGLGSAYGSISPAALVGTALAGGGDMAIGGALTAFSISGGSLSYSNGMFGALSAQKACINDFSANVGNIGGVPIATTLDVASTVTSFNMRTGPVFLELDDILCAGGAPIFSPRFLGNPRAMTPCPESNSTRLATTAYVTNAITNVTLDFAPLDSPNFSGYATAPTAPPGTNDGQIATTAFVQLAVEDSTTGVVSFNGRTGIVVFTPADLTAVGGAPIASPAFTGVPTAPTAGPGTNTTQIATTAFVEAAVAAATAGVASFNGRTGVVTLTSADVGAVGVSAFNGRIGSITLLANDVSAAGGAVLASPAFTGVPTAPTAGPGTNTTQIATTAFVMAQIAASVPGPSAAAPLVNGTAAPGASASWSRGDHVHPTDTSRAAATDLANYLPLAGGGVTGNLTVGGVFVVAGGTSSIICSTNDYITIVGANGFSAPGSGAIILNGGARPTYAIEFYTASTRIGTFDGAGNFTITGAGSQPGGGAWAATSDERTKTVLGDYEQGLDDVLTLRPVRYVYRGNDAARGEVSANAKVAEDKTTFVGLVAQEIEAVFPGMVTMTTGFIDGVKVADLRRVNTTELVFALVNAVKTLAARVATLEAAA